jgi:hypothetical protein
MNKNVAVTSLKYLEWESRVKKIIGLVFLSTFAVSSCAPAANFSPYPKPAMVTMTATALPTTTATALPPRTRTNTPIGPTEEFLRKNSFGDGYIAHIPISEVKGISNEEIVNILVVQWLEHYKIESTAVDAVIKDYKIEGIGLMDGRNDGDPAILAGVEFSIIPGQIPNVWASFPGEAISADDPWWHLVISFGVYGHGPKDDYYWLRILPLG